MSKITLTDTASIPDFQWAETGKLKTRPLDSRLSGNDQGSKPAAFTNEAGMWLRMSKITLTDTASIPDLHEDRNWKMENRKWKLGVGNGRWFPVSNF